MLAKKVLRGGVGGTGWRNAVSINLKTGNPGIIVWQPLNKDGKMYTITDKDRQIIYHSDFEVLLNKLKN